MSHRLEILAPAGDAACLDAALRAGADAVYFGLDCGFNARARAENFSAADLTELMDRIHDHGRRGYVTLNTLVFDDELEQVASLIGHIAEAGVDAIIVQDLAVARLAKRIAPELRLHASTQTTCTDADAIQFLADLGVKRITLARELSLEQVSTLAQSSSLELEIFAHGALCIAYSGQCLTSEAIGGRSANRGACAQACRLPYDLVVDGVLRDVADAAYLLSPRDLDASRLLPELIASGVRAIKIEGRLKGPEYVAATTLLYRRALEHATQVGVPVSPQRAELERIHELSTQSFSRGGSTGFLSGTNHQQLIDGTACDHIGIELGRYLGSFREAGRVWLRLQIVGQLMRGDGILIQGGRAGAGEFGGRVWSLRIQGRAVERAEAVDEVAVWLGPDRPIPEAAMGRRVFRTSLGNATNELSALMPKEVERVGLRARFSGALGEGPRLTFEAADGRVAEVTLEQPLERAQRRPLDADAIRDKLERLGDTRYRLEGLEVAIPEASIVPISALNRARRDASAILQRAAHRPIAVRRDFALDELLAWPNQAAPAAGLYVTCRTREQALAALDAGAHGIYLDFLALTGTGPLLRELRAAGHSWIGIALPRIRKPGEEKIDAYVLSLDASAILVRSLGSLAALERRAREDVAAPHQPTLIGDFSLNAINTLAALDLMARSLAAFTPGYDLDAAQLLALLDSPMAAFAEVVLYHPMPLFHMEHCVFAALLSKGKDYRDCGRPCEKHVVSLRDRTGLDLPLEADVGCRNTVFHGIAQSAADLIPRLQQQGVKRFRIELVRETGEQTAALVRAHLDLLDGRLTAHELPKLLGGLGMRATRI